MGSPKKHAPLKTHLQNNTTSTMEPGYQEAAFLPGNIVSIIL